jgi:hypothetical protein
MNLSYVEIATTVLVAVLSVLAAWLRRADARNVRKIEAVEAQVTPNGGSSLRDAIDRIERRLDDLTTTVEAGAARIETLEQVLTWRCCPRTWVRRCGSAPRLGRIIITSESASPRAVRRTRTTRSP